MLDRRRQNQEDSIKNQIKEIISLPIFTTIMRLMVGFIFILASLGKIASPAYFAGTILNYQILPESMINLAAIVLPWLEFICGLSLLLGFWHQASAIILSSLTFIFIMAIASVIIRGLTIDCGCFGTNSSADWGRIVEDLFIFAFSLQIVFHPLSKLAVENINKSLE